MRAKGGERGGLSPLLYPASLAFSVSLATLLLQLVQTRIYSVIYWNHLVYFIISIALLGFGISGTWLTFEKTSKVARCLSLPNCATGFIISTMVASYAAPQLGLTISGIFEFRYLAGLFATYVVAVLPYFFAGWILGSLFRDYVRHIHFLYFADLAGAAAGCLLFLAGMQPLGAVVLALVTCIAVGLPIVLGSPASTRSRAGLALCLAGSVLLLPFHDAINRRIVPEKTKAFVDKFAELPPGEEKIWEFSEWNAISRIDVAGTTGSPARQIFIDGDAFTGLVWEAETPVRRFDPEGHPPLTDHRSPFYFLDEPENVLVIGSGGGVDVWAALRGGAQHVDAVEINPTTYRLVREEYRERSKDIFFRPGVSTYNLEGRSFIRRTDRKYEAIILHGIDTFAAINAGAYVLSENYLYTVDAIKDYITHLTDAGMLCISRWHHYAETPRLFSVCLEALYELGAESPERHILLHGGNWGTILVKKTPFTPEEIGGFRDYVLRREAHFIYPVENPETGDAVTKTIAEYADVRTRGEEDAYLAALPFDISPVYDDSPFFFHFDRLGNFMGVRSDATVTEWVRGHWPSFTLLALLGFTVFAVAVFMFAPLLRMGVRGIPRFGSHLTYFACLGVSFIFVEIALMQRFALLLGHPSRSLALVLTSLLFFAGVGSWLASRPRMNLAYLLPALVLTIVGTTYWYPSVITYALPWSFYARAALTVALVAPLGILMGMPFPTGLRLVSQWGGTAVPWMWGVNGGTTVLGSVLAIVLAIHFSFSTVLLTAAGGYGLAYVMYRRIAGLRSSERSGG